VHLIIVSLPTNATVWLIALLSTKLRLLLLLLLLVLSCKHRSFNFKS